MSKDQQSRIGESWVCTTPGTVVCSSGSFNIAALAEQLELSVLSGTPSNCLINQITIDSREVRSGSLFIALSGSKSDGHDFIDQAVDLNCSALLVEKGRVKREVYEDRGICVFETSNTRAVYGVLAEILFAYPAKNMNMFGVTGTNGKTSVSYLLESVLRQAGKQPGVLGTINYRYYDAQGDLIRIPSSFTTPEPLLLQEILRKMADNGVDSVIMEISSHGLEQNRIGTLAFDVAAFTNLSRDHLDYHPDMESYFAAKTLLFTNHLRNDGKAVTTFSAEDCKWSKRLQDLCAQNGVAVLSCGEPEKSGIYPLSVVSNLRKTDITFQTPEGVCSFSSSLVGDFNVTNLQTTFAMAMASGIPVSTICTALSTAAGAPGRMEQVRVSANEQGFRPAVFVDYAHTPDALEQILKTVKALPHTALYCVFGCGGDRDAGKRPLMGTIAGKYSDIVILTDDNPRSEDSGSIIDEVARGLNVRACQSSWLGQKKRDERGFVTIPDRHRAIAAAIAAAGADDIVLIAGKGHEEYQLTSKGKIFFNDTLEAAEALSNWKLESLLLATDGKLLRYCNPGRSMGSINTDSRTIQPDDVFVALKGERFDGHDYAEQVAAAGAGCLILEHEPETSLSVPVVLVKDTEQALGDLARYRRANMKEISTPRVIGITGSSGKTTVKEMCAAIFSKQWPEQADSPSGRVLKTEGNFNNLIGLPLSLLPVSPKHKAVILEMGMNAPGEIARLTDIADPDIACIVNVHGAHLQGLGDIEGVARAKAELFHGCGPETVLVINGDDPRVVDVAGSCAQRKIFFGISDASSQLLDVYATHCKTGGQEDVAFMLHVKEQEQQVVLQVPGAYNISNALAAAAIAVAAGIDIRLIAAGLSAFRPTDRRMQIFDGPAGSRVINDTYNANPESMKAGVDTLCELGSGTRVAVLGDMLELGPDSEALHRMIGASAADYGIDFLGVLGDFAVSTASGAIEQGMDKERVHVFGEKEACICWLKELVSTGNIKSGTYVLVKGSRGMRLENLVERLIGEQ
jgi:murE/murF fusion protein